MSTSPIVPLQRGGARRGVPADRIQLCGRVQDDESVS